MYTPNEININRSFKKLKSELSFTPDLLTFGYLLEKSTEIYNPKLFIIVHRLLHSYMNIFENSDRNFIQNLKTKNIIVWDDSSDYPSFWQKRSKIGDSSMASEVDKVEKLISEYRDDKELNKHISKDEIYLIAHFLYKLVKNLWYEDKNALTLAVNLLPEWNRRQIKVIENEIDEEFKNGNVEYIYMNFMIRSYKYFKQCK